MTFLHHEKKLFLAWRHHFNSIAKYAWTQWIQFNQTNSDTFTQICNGRSRIDFTSILFVPDVSVTIVKVYEKSLFCVDYMELFAEILDESSHL